MSTQARHFRLHVKSHARYRSKYTSKKQHPLWPRKGLIVRRHHQIKNAGTWPHTYSTTLRTCKHLSSPNSCLMITPHCLNITRTALQVPLKSLCNFKHLDDMFHSQRLLLVDRKSLSRAYCILDLRWQFSQILKMAQVHKVHTCRPLRLRRASLS